jgi:threonine dehydratase
VAQKLGIPAVIGLGEHVPENKVRDILGYGAETLIAGETWDETVAQTAKVQQARGLTYIEAFDDPQIIAGQGTLMLEVLERYPWIDTVLVPLSGGGLASGVALAAKSINPDIRVVGVSQTGGPAMYLSIRAGVPVDVPEPPTLADALLGGIGQDNRYTFNLCRHLLDDSVLVSEDEIAEAMAFLLNRHHQAVEGAGAVGVAALLQQNPEIGEHTLIVISGGSVKSATLLSVMQKYLK